MIVLWTKADALDIDKIGQLMNEGNSLVEAMKEGPEKAWAEFERENYPMFNRLKYPPKAYVRFRGEYYSYSYLVAIS